MTETKWIAGMQPYFFPYIGYFQLINAASLFIVYDDGKMITHGYMHRNAILSPDYSSRQPISINISSGAYFKQINEVELADNTRNIRKMLKTMRHIYSKAPYYKEVMPMLEECMLYKEKNLCRYLVYSLRRVCQYIGINTPFVFSSEVSKEGCGNAEDRIIRLCDHYDMHDLLNPIGGKELYDKIHWADRGVNLSFIHRSDKIRYRQMKEEFVKDLSIIDVLMFCSKDEIKKILEEYSLE